MHVIVRMCARVCVCECLCAGMFELLYSNCIVSVKFRVGQCLRQTKTAHTAACAAAAAAHDLDGPVRVGIV